MEETSTFRSEIKRLLDLNNFLDNALGSLVQTFLALKISSYLIFIERIFC